MELVIACEGVSLTFNLEKAKYMEIERTEAWRQVSVSFLWKSDKF